MAVRTFWFDVDGVLLNLERAIRECMYAHLGRAMPDDTPVSSYSFEESFGIPDAMLGPPTDPPNNLWRAIWGNPCESYPWAADLTKSAMAAGFLAISISFRPGSAARQASLRDLSRASIPLDDRLYTDSASEKIAHFNPGDAYIDDHPKYAANVAHACPNVSVFLLEQPWNAYCADLGAYKRVSAKQLTEKMKWGDL